MCSLFYVNYTYSRTVKNEVEKGNRTNRYIEVRHTKDKNNIYITERKNEEDS